MRVRWLAFASPSEITEHEVSTSMLFTRRATAAAAAATSCAAAKLLASCDTTAPPSFDAWETTLQKKLGASSRIDFQAEVAPFLATRTDKYFLWQTLTEGERRIKRIAAWRWLRPAEESEPTNLADGPVSGRARMSVLVQLGDELNGHDGVVHGGFSAALMDDLVGWVTMAETAAQGLPGAPLTSTLNLRYRRPCFGDRTYQANMRAVRVERRDRPGPPSWAVTAHGEIVDEMGNVCVEAEVLYVVKTFDAATLASATGQAPTATKMGG